MNGHSYPQAAIILTLIRDHSIFIRYYGNEAILDISFGVKKTLRRHWRNGFSCGP